jgi:hypothetical protein
MGEYIEVGDDLFTIIAKISVIASAYEDALKLFDEGMNGFLDGGNGYLGKTKENLDLYHESFNANVEKLINYLEVSVGYVYNILQKFAAEDEELARALKMALGDGLK